MFLSNLLLISVTFVEIFDFNILSGAMIDAGNEINREEIQNLLNIVRRDLKDSEVKGLTEDWHFAIAYNATLQIYI